MQSYIGNPVLSLANETYPMEQFQIRVTKDDFTDFSDSLIIKYNDEKLSLNELFNYDIDVKSGKIINSDILSISAENNRQRLRNITVQENKPPNIYNISISPSKHTEPSSNAKLAYSTYAAFQNKNLSKFSSDKMLNESKKLIQSGKIGQAEIILDKAVLHINDNSWMLAEVAGIYEMAKKYNKAANAYKKAVSINPERIELLFGYALCLTKANMLDNAKVQLEKVISINPEFMLAYYNLGNIYYKKGNYYDALSAYKKSIQLNPVSADSFYNLALTLEVLNYKKIAKKYYSRCLELKPNDLAAQKAIYRLSKT